MRIKRNGQIYTTWTSHCDVAPYSGWIIAYASNAIVWAHENTSPAVLHAYDASNLAHELYNSNQATGSRDQFGPGNKFIAPTVAGGKVFVGTTNTLAIFGLLQ
jgi:hypothetical protein